ncbi:hypothetical protein B0I35DRAFT_437242 [Stachybotrys elegans]|uniref:Rhodopsin domain-containing protein n=1 Tax=Stachybotrys elegans TaxID=80388 RepID=A0A8K0SMS5_9HYPO|nr:hypothetical protein B0I35DRAFT_437242 [Stachybotrys elegans]
MMDSHQPNLLACLIITFVLATTAISLRFLSRRLTGIQLWWDDWFAMAGYVIAISWMILTPFWICYGLGKHYQDITERPLDETLYMNRLLLFIAELLYAFALFFGKTSILMFYWRMFGVTNIKIAIKVLMGCAIIWIIVRTIMGIWHCIPVEAFWDVEAGGHCAINDSRFFFGTLTVHIVIDVAILTLPVIQIQKLQLPKLQKLAVMIMFMFGILSVLPPFARGRLFFFSFELTMLSLSICIAAAVIIHESVHFDAASNDFAWSMGSIIIWATAEVNLVVVSACLPTLRPAFNFILGRTPTSRTKRSSTHGYGSRGGLSSRRSVRVSTINDKRSSAGNIASAFQLDDSLQGGSWTGEIEENINAVGHSAFVSTRQREDCEDRAEYDVEGRGGVMVKNETTVHVSRAKHDDVGSSTGE